MQQKYGRCKIMSKIFEENIFNVILINKNDLHIKT